MVVEGGEKKYFRYMFCLLHTLWIIHMVLSFSFIYTFQTHNLLKEIRKKIKYLYMWHVQLKKCVFQSMTMKGEGKREKRGWELNLHVVL